MNDVPINIKDESAGSPADVLTLRYRALRAHIGEIEKKHKAELAKWKAAMDELESKMSGILTQIGAKHIATPNGTFYFSTRHSASIQDKDLFKGYVIENRAWNMLDWKCNATEAQAFAKEHEQEPPGVKISSVTSVNVVAPR